MNGIMIESETGELAIKNGTLQIGNTDEQNIEMVLLSNKGEFKEHPILGAGLVNYKNSIDRELEITRQIKIQLGLLGYNHKKVSMENGVLTIKN